MNKDLYLECTKDSNGVQEYNVLPIDKVLEGTATLCSVVMRLQINTSNQTAIIIPAPKLIE